MKKWNIVNKITANFKTDGQNEPSHRKQKGRPKDAQPAGTEEGREVVLLVVGGYLIHCPSNIN